MRQMRKHTNSWLEELESRALLSAPSSAPSLGAPPPPGPNVIWVSTEPQLQKAVQDLQSGQEIVIQPGTYYLSHSLNLGLTRPLSNVTIRGATDNYNDVVLLGMGMDNASAVNTVPDGIGVYNAQNVTIANLSIGRTYFDAIDLKGDWGAAGIHIYHTRLFDTGEQIIKANPNSNGIGVTNSSVQYSVIEYTAGPSQVNHGGGTGYTNGVDVLDGSGWTISNNLFRNFHVPDTSTNKFNPVVLFWDKSSGAIVEGNTFINCDRAIAFGLVHQSSGYDNQGGIIRNNFIEMDPGLFSAARKAGSDSPIIVWDSPGTKVDQNTILTNGNTLDSIQVRWTATGTEVGNNLVDAPIGARDGAAFASSGNYLGATPGMFVAPRQGDLHLVANRGTRAHVINQVSLLADVPTDWDGQTRPIGAKTDIGAN